MDISRRTKKRLHACSPDEIRDGNTNSCLFKNGKIARQRTNKSPVIFIHPETGRKIRFHTAYGRNIMRSLDPRIARDIKFFTLDNWKEARRAISSPTEDDLERVSRPIPRSELIPKRAIKYRNGSPLQPNQLPQLVPGPRQYSEYRARRGSRSRSRSRPRQDVNDNEYGNPFADYDVRQASVGGDIPQNVVYNFDENLLEPVDALDFLEEPAPRRRQTISRERRRN